MGDKLTDGVDALALEAVVRTLRQVEVLNRNGHLGVGLLGHRGRTDLDAFSLGVELTAQAEELHQGGTGGSHRVTRGDGGLGLHVQDELVEVRALFHTGGLDLVAHLEYRGVDGINRNTADLIVVLLVHLGRNIATATLDSELDLEFSISSSFMAFDLSSSPH